MFKLQCLVDDRHLARVMHSLAGVARDLQVVPVINATVHKDRVEATTNSHKTLDLMAAWLIGYDTLKPADIRNWLKSIGRSPASYSHYVEQAVKARLIKRHGKSSNTTYTTVKS